MNLWKSIRIAFDKWVIVYFFKLLTKNNYFEVSSEKCTRTSPKIECNKKSLKCEFFADDNN